MIATARHQGPMQGNVGAGPPMAKLEPCPNCDKEISSQATTCPKCGHPLSEEVWENARAERSKVVRQTAVTTCVLFIVVAISVTAWIMWPTYTHPKKTVAGNEKVEKVEEKVRKCWYDEISAYHQVKYVVRDRFRSIFGDYFGSDFKRIRSVKVGECSFRVEGLIDGVRYTVMVEGIPYTDRYKWELLR